ncbi:alpha/beta hydrolase [Nocardioides caldifontis]|uniref:alpha/beta hydrolase n=1 Tax=Nocardioides caldifontis TaxID=2588938 RepID=UPI0011DFB97C|nr:CocE/NonD family hydrolase [Nocardioides caldifontis]
MTARTVPTAFTGFTVAAVLVLVHVVDEALLRVPAGVGWQPRVASSAVLVGLVALGTAAFRSRRPWLSSLVASILGTVASAHGATHLLHATQTHVDGADVTGTGMLLGGVGLLVLAAAALVRRPRSAGGRAARVVRHGVTALAAATVSLTVLVPVAVGTVQVHLPRRAPAPPPAISFGRVELHTTDDVRLAAWYHPSANGAAVVLLSTARGDHPAVDAHARMLADNGYGVLVYDARGTGASDGVPNGWGWTWGPDVDAALDYLAARPDVENGIGLLGLSTGADVALEVAAHDPRVDAVVADGATAQGFADRPDGALTALSLLPMYATARALTGEHAQPPLTHAATAIAPRPVLLIAGGSIEQELALNARYAHAGGPTTTLWPLPDTAHTAGLAERPTEYTRRVLTHFDGALLPAPSPAG